MNGPSASIERRRFLQLTEFTDSLLAIDVPGRPPLYLATALHAMPPSEGHPRALRQARPGDPQRR